MINAVEVTGANLPFLSSLVQKEQGCCKKKTSAHLFFPSAVLLTQEGLFQASSRNHSPITVAQINEVNF